MLLWKPVFWRAPASLTTDPNSRFLRRITVEIEDWDSVPDYVGANSTFQIHLHAVYAKHFSATCSR